MSEKNENRPESASASPTGIPSPSGAGEPHVAAAATARPGSRETGGPPGPEPTRYGDWERKGRCIDF